MNLRIKSGVEVSWYSENFGVTLTKLMSKSDVSGYKISQFTGLDQAYMSRLKNGEKTEPSVRTLVKISFALMHHSNDITLDDIDDLFESAGRSPLT